MKLVIYDQEHNIKEIRENILSPVVEGNDVRWEGGSLTGIKFPFILLDDELEVGETLTDEIIQLDKKEEYPAHDLVEENLDLRTRLESAEAAILTLMDIV
ncbi:hypothetical protein [Mesobacillus sp. S13]|uniref:hypothetical protein n=1 Tax=Mesobacillus sp. S13 TaxID=2880221 RepID=UPI001CF25C72|nr:hypothetical protein [Mesobacillus sp. S13]